MISFGNMKVGARLGLGFGAVIAVFLVVSVVAFMTSSKQEEMERWNKHTYKVLGENEAMMLSMVNMETGARGFLLAGEDQFLGPWKDGIKSFDEAWAEAKKLAADNPVQQERLEKMRDRHNEFEAVMESLIKSRREVSAGKLSMAEFLSLFGQGRDKAAMDAYRELEGEFDKMERDLLVKRSAEAESSRQIARSSAIGGTSLAIVLGALLAFAITRMITFPLNVAVGVAQRVAAGDLTSTVEVKSKDETGLLLQALKDMNESLRKIVGEVRSGTEAIGSGTKQIASGNADLSQRTEEQASSLEETASSMEELTSTVKQNAENAKQANQLALGASTVALKGGQVVSQVVETMSSINESSKKIVDIISVIDGIAFQTNILALNAAVEAARAGEQGRGFAVVATEVRTLAQRSAAAAKEIKALIGDSVDKVGAGTKLVDEAGKTMEEIVISVKRVTDIMSEITAASQEQSAGIEQVNQAITQMDEVTQQNAALVEEAAAAAESLEEQAQNLDTAVAVFKLAHDTRHASAMAKVDNPAVAKAAEAHATEHHAGGRAGNVARIPAKSMRKAVAKPAVGTKTGTDGEWAEF